MPDLLLSDGLRPCVGCVAQPRTRTWCLLRTRPSENQGRAGLDPPLTMRAETVDQDPPCLSPEQRTRSPQPHPERQTP
ncbi:hypothetical protein HMPREF9123_1279 [Neisseria bacilliformis ATCC BAA-1200]|uniref:Uncharacterized protein n=1 Tax=Neisseria bacilliformis ATCC BAA-1200 TaxID=888742 RepID=F2BC24_9NEIS|nr:hypothetical protein HMPREF9123_1279 [Neisseria bacilliformis ATCC BAA-1200]